MGCEGVAISVDTGIVAVTVAFSESQASSRYGDLDDLVAGGQAQTLVRVAGLGKGKGNTQDIADQRVGA